MMRFIRDSYCLQVFIGLVPGRVAETNEAECFVDKQLFATLSGRSISPASTADGEKILRHRRRLQRPPETKVEEGLG